MRLPGVRVLKAWLAESVEVRAGLGGCAYTELALRAESGEQDAV